MELTGRELSESKAGSASSALDALAKTPSRTVERFIRKASAPVYLLPLGPNPENYFIMMEFEEMLEKLREGLLVRPILMLYVGRSDFDHSYFADHLKDEFVRQFSEAREQEYSKHQVDIEVMRLQKESARDEMARPLRAYPVT